MAELAPARLGSLVRRLFREHQREGKIFDLPARKFWKGDPALETSVRFHGRRAENPLGPAAGPHGQMAQNILLAWLAGSRVIELKTVQVDDRLRIPRPCIDMATVGFNVEWSQELRLEESLREYVKGSMLIDIVRGTGRLGPSAGPEERQTLFDMSVGYDLAGIRSGPVRAWIEAMKDARAIVDEQRQELPSELGELRGVDFETRLSRQVTLSTFHGCPAGEVVAIGSFLLRELDVDLTIKLNPTLLGRGEVDGLLRDQLGYTEIETRGEDFDADLKWDQALEACDRLLEVARACGRGFGIKLSNTLVVRNEGGVFPSRLPVRYLSGQPLHVITLQLLGRFREARPELPVSFSAGVDSRNFADCVALGLCPITTCTDLLRPGGYGRLPAYLRNLEERMRGLGVRCLGDYVIGAFGQGRRAVAEVVRDPALRATVLSGLEPRTTEPASSSLPGGVEAVLLAAGCGDLYEALVQRAALLNTPLLVERASRDPRYAAARNRTAPRKVGSRLALFDCLNCDKCLPACPNDANFAYDVVPISREYQSYQVSDGVARPVPGGRFVVEEAHQIGCFQGFCNECGNCDTFCPEDGGPYLEKPRFFPSLRSFKDGGEGFFVRREGTKDAIWGRRSGVEYHLEVDRLRDRAFFTDGRVTVSIEHSQRRPLEAATREGAAEGHRLDGAVYLAMATIVDGVLGAARMNPINADYLLGDGGHGADGQG